MHINFLATHPHFTRLGLARDLLKRAEAIVRADPNPHAIKRITLKVRKDNPIAIRSYDGRGFHQTDDNGVQLSLERPMPTKKPMFPPK